MSWTDFDNNSALERDILRRALPLAPTASDGNRKGTVDLSADTAAVSLVLGGVIGGAAPANCLDLLQIRPLLVGAAWKVLDLLLETALAEAGETPDQSQGWSIDAKARKAQSRTGRPAGLQADVWNALMETYVGTVEIRHSLVHRTVRADPSNALVGVDRNGNPLRALSPDEQEALTRTALRSAELVLSPANPRVERDLRRQLSHLVGLHGMHLGGTASQALVPELTVIIDPDPDVAGNYLLGVPALKARQPFSTESEIDLIVVFRDRQGQELGGRLEDAPDEDISINPDNPPFWLN